MHVCFCSADVRCPPRVSTCFHLLLLHVVFCISSTSLRNMTSLVSLPNREWFVVCGQGEGGGGTKLYNIHYRFFLTSSGGYRRVS